MRVTQGTFSFLPDLTDEQIEAQIHYALRQRLGDLGRVHRRPPSAQRLLGAVEPAAVRPAARAGRRRDARGEGLPRGDPQRLRQGRSPTTRARRARRPRWASSSTARRRSPASASSAPRSPIARSATRCTPTRPSAAGRRYRRAPGRRRVDRRRAARARAACRRCWMSSTASSWRFEPVKTRIREIAALLVIDRLRREDGPHAQPPSLHMCFTGNPGTGKTTVALRMAEILQQLGYVEKPRWCRSPARTSWANTSGTPHPRRRTCSSAPTAACCSSTRPTTCTARRTSATTARRRSRSSCRSMENERDKLVVILAGYKDRMDAFFRPNPGMASRVAHHVDFPDYTSES